MILTRTALQQIKHTDQGCVLLALRIACEKCGYSASEALYLDAEDFLKTHHNQNKL